MLDIPAHRLRARARRESSALRSRRAALASLHRSVFAAVAAAWFCAPAAHAVVTVEAGDPVAATVDVAETLGGSVTGRSILDYIVADGDDSSLMISENKLVTYDDISGVQVGGELLTAGGAMTYGWPSGLVRNSSSVTYGVDTFHQQIFVLNEATGEVTPFAGKAGGAAWNTRMGGLTYDAVGDVLYAVDWHGNADRLWSFDLATQSWAVEYAGLPSNDAHGLSLDDVTSLLYVYDANNNQIYTLDPTTGATVNIVQPTLDPGAAFAGETFLELFFDEIVFHDDDELYGALRFTIDNGTEVLDYSQIQRIDLATGATRDIGPVIAGTDSHSLLFNSVPEIVEWSVDSGPGTVTFVDAEDPATDATFSAAGEYVLRLTAFASPVVSDTVTVSVTTADACSDGQDNDGDGLIDFPADPGCADATDTTETDAALVCDDGIDNDLDGVIDAADPGCSDPLDTTETNASVACDDGLDNDNDSLVDTADPSCASPAGTSEKSPGLVCDDGIDNDGDRLRDLNDPGCSSVFDSTETDAALPCDDGIDNDGDGLLDAADPGCTHPFDTAETDPGLVCDDGIDNDGDGMADFGTDPGCGSATFFTESPVCQDGIDNDGDGSIDFDGGASIFGAGSPLIVAPDPTCAGQASLTFEKASVACGLGADLVAVLPVWVFFRKRRERRLRLASAV